jgi:hypothetical protein
MSVFGHKIGLEKQLIRLFLRLNLKIYTKLVLSRYGNLFVPIPFKTFGFSSQSYSMNVTEYISYYILKKFAILFQGTNPR